MGILTRKHNGDWMISIREEWGIPQKKGLADDMRAFEKFLNDNEIPCFISFKEEYKSYKFDDIVIKRGDFKSFEKLIKELLGYKNIYGEVKEVM